MQRKKNPKVSVILPTYNEKDNIKEMIRQLLFYVKGVEIIVSDDNSPDGTWKIVQGISKKNKSIELLRRYRNKGVGPAIVDGIKKANGDYVIWMDADLTMPPRLLPSMIKLLKKYDVVVGSRYVNGGGDDRSFVRVMSSRAINMVANIVLNSKVMDYNSGFIVTKRKVLDNVKFSSGRHGEYCIDFIYKSLKKGYSVKEFGYKFTERKMGTSKTARYLYEVLYWGFVYIWKIIKLRAGLN